MKKKRTRPVPLCLAMLMPLASLALICWSLIGHTNLPDMMQPGFQPMNNSTAPEDAAGRTKDASPARNAADGVNQDRLAEPLVLRHQARQPHLTPARRSPIGITELQIHNP